MLNKVLSIFMFTLCVAIAAEARDLKITVEQRDNYQEVLFYGGFNKESPFKDQLLALNTLKDSKDILLVIQRGFGGSVNDHKEFMRTLREKCPLGLCQIITYLEGQCSSMCTTLFLSGDRRIAREDSFANLGFHRTLIRIGRRSIPIQTVNSMVRYFSKFPGVDSQYLEENKRRLFKQPNNQLSHVHGQELLNAGMAHELIDMAPGDYQNPILVQLLLDSL
jgi:ATP-dependent protease ClpP protease subunit